MVVITGWAFFFFFFFFFSFLFSRSTLSCFRKQDKPTWTNNGGAYVYLLVVYSLIKPPPEAMTDVRACLRNYTFKSCNLSSAFLGERVTAKSQM